MKCPRDEAQLTAVKVGDVTLNPCPDCLGLWHDKDELRRMKDRESLEDYRWMDIDLWKEREQFRADAQERYNCPRDAGAMVTVHYDGSDVVVDVCPECEGIWLDRPEYDAIIAYLDKQVNTTEFKEYLKHLREEVVEIVSGPESMLSEWQDMDSLLALMQMRFGAEHPGLAGASRSLPRF